jgi:hypothetical protein
MSSFSQIATRDSLYKQLDSKLKEIRLIVLNPGLECQQITCELIIVNLTDYPQPKFAALSYEWGNSEHPRYDIEISRQPFSVQKNLWQALIHLRSRDQKQILWIDAICINQDDIQERNHHVGIMGQVYSTAEEVKVWLGPGLPRDRLYISDAFALLNSVRSNPELYCPSTAWKCGFSKANCTTADEELSWHGEIKGAKEVLEKIICASYWKRIWIVQEYVLARKLLIHHGYSSISGEVFDLALNHLYYLRGSAPAPAMVVSRHRTARAALPLANLIRIYHDSLSTDPRDKVYALLGLASDVADNGIAADYNKSNLEVLFDVAVSLCTTWVEGGKCGVVNALTDLEQSLQLRGVEGFREVFLYFSDIEKGLQSGSKEKIDFLSLQQVIAANKGRLS